MMTRNSRNLIWNPWHELMNLDRAFAPFFGGNCEFPPTNVWTSDNGITVTFEMPGIKPENIEVSAKADTLTVKGQRVVEEAPEGAQYFRRERSEGTFSRSYALPFKIDQEQVQASYVNGILTVTLPKAREVQPRKISILNN